MTDDVNDNADYSEDLHLLASVVALVSLALMATAWLA